VWRRPAIRAVVAAMLLDVVAVLLFVALGRRSHDAGSGVAAVLSTAAPFLIALAAAWLVVLTGRMAPLAALTGVVLWVITVAGGLALRRTLWDRGTATSFVVVAAVALGILLVGWRGVLTFARGASRAPTSQEGPTSTVRSASPPPGAGR